MKTIVMSRRDFQVPQFWSEPARGWRASDYANARFEGEFRTKREAEAHLAHLRNGEVCECESLLIRENEEGWSPTPG